MNWYLAVLKKYTEFGGRAHRTEFWMYTLFNFIVSIVLGMVDGMLHLHMGYIGILQGLYALAVLLPGLAVTIRRLHDTGRSGWWFLIVLVPLIGVIVLLVFLVQDSESGDNAYGANPKGAPAPA